MTIVQVVTTGVLADSRALTGEAPPSEAGPIETSDLAKLKEPPRIDMPR